MHIDKVELIGGYQVVVENDGEKQKTLLGVDNWSLMFSSPKEVTDHIALLQKALEFWEFDNTTSISRIEKTK